MSRCIAFHSYKGGTGKTTIAINLAGLLAKKGHRVFILDLDMYAPGLHSYFGDSVKGKIRHTINDYIIDNCKVDDLLVDLTSSLKEITTHDIQGELWGCFSSPTREDILKIEGIKEDKHKLSMLKRFILLTQELFLKHNADYIILDSSPGIRFWAINALAVADIVFLTLKMGELDIEGTKMIIKEILDRFKDTSDTKYFLLLNRISGYCNPPVNTDHIPISIEQTSDPILKKIKKDHDVDIISAIPCYCDIQFKQKEFMTALEYPEHPFSDQFAELIKLIDAN